MATELVLVRHGHAVRVKGQYVRAPLTDLGRKQAELTGLYFCNESIHADGFYTSPLRRTKETSALIGSKINQVPAIQNGIQELEGFEVPMLVLMEFLAHAGWFGKMLYENAGKPIHWPIVGRVSQVLTEILKKHEGGRVVVVTHSGVIGSVLAWYFPSERRRWWRYTVKNCSLTRLMIEGNRATLIAVDETKHLSAALTTQQPPAPSVQAANKAEQKAEDVATPIAEKTQQVVTKAQEAAAPVAEKAQQVAAPIAEKAQQMAAPVADKAKEVTAQIAGNAQAATTPGGDTTQDTLQTDNEKT